MLRRLALSLCLAPLLLTACHDDGMVQAPPDMALPGGPYPAIAPDQPQVVTRGGPVLSAPTVVVVTFDGDGLRHDIETMISTVGSTPYWHDATSEYGVGPLTLAKTIHIADPAPAMITDEEIQAWLAAQLDGTHPEWPQPTPQTIYAVFYPQSTTITQQSSQSCAEFGGYHADAPRPGLADRIIYAVLPRCQYPGMSMLQYLTTATSHELIEAVEDPQPLSNPAFESVDDAHFQWMRLLGGGEAGDLCAQEPTSAFQPDGYAYYVQRSWSNAAALAGQDPCVPAVKDPPYFNTSPTSALDDITLNFGPSFSLDVKGWDILVSQSRMIDFKLYSTAPMAGPWTLDAIDLTAARTGATSSITFAFDKTTGVNGDTVHLTITPHAKSTGRSGATTFMIRSKLGKVEHFWLGLIHTP